LCPGATFAGPPDPAGDCKPISAVGAMQTEAGGDRFQSVGRTDSAGIFYRIHDLRTHKGRGFPARRMARSF